MLAKTSEDYLLTTLLLEVRTFNKSRSNKKAPRRPESNKGVRYSYNRCARLRVLAMPPRLDEQRLDDWNLYTIYEDDDSEAPRLPELIARVTRIWYN